MNIGCNRSEHPAPGRLVVIGNGMVGQRFLEELITEPHGFEITVFAGEPRVAYDRVNLTGYLSGKSADDLALTTRAWFEAHGVALITGDPVAHIDRAAKEVRTASGLVCPFDRLVIATGSVPFVPPIPGNDLPGCFVYRTLEDLDAIRAAAAEVKEGVVIGGGLLGLEAARALHDLGLETRVIEFAPGLMSVQLDPDGSLLLRRKIEALGVQVLTGTSTRSIARCTEGLALDLGEKTLQTGLVVFSAGIRPADQLARACGLETGERGGIVIDDTCTTSDPDILAIGEVALWHGRIFGLVAPGYTMARVAVATVLGRQIPRFEGADMSTRLKLLGVEVASIGDAHGRTEGAQAIAVHDSAAGTYRKIVTSADGKHLLGAVLVGDSSDYPALLNRVLSATPLNVPPLALLAPATASGGNTLELDNSALVCTCNNVDKGSICKAVQEGCSTVGAVKAATRASASCGGCAPLVKTVLEAELKRLGSSVNHHLCEHFPHTRQELMHIVRISGIRTFSELIGNHGRGLGCDICKPAVASILASCWNDYVLSPDHAPLQDTNDRYLANLQKDGTYSVIPRIPGGEITPDRLATIAAVAKKFDLYTKITGGQRIDLLGARVEQLPLIWKDLVDAGFESGHAYGKALRTVKSCVGSTWCRYGVQDSVTMAIRLEERYRGLRSPHKLKMAVSGCTRECAEAQSKDIGVIATEKGWSLYVCGNGGMRPRHAERFATDLDDETLIRTIDRLLMFYIRTADRLQRTSVWRENLEGGIDYLREVILEDSLAIGAELEAQMQAVVDTYVCEWKQTLEDPEAPRRFKPFINDTNADENVVFVRERGQKRPARPEEKQPAGTGGQVRIPLEALT